MRLLAEIRNYKSKSKATFRNRNPSKTASIVYIYKKKQMKSNDKVGRHGATASLLALAIILTGCQQKSFNSEERSAEQRSQLINACTDKPFRCEVRGTVKDGWYFIVSQDTVEPTYAITVKNEAVTGDYSEDEYGCMSKGCDEIMYSKASRNMYKSLNEKQISRTTPNGLQYVLSWYKPLD